MRSQVSCCIVQISEWLVFAACSMSCIQHAMQKALWCAAAPVSWRNEQNYTLRRTICALGVPLMTFVLIRKCTQGMTDDGLFIAVVVAQIVAIVSFGTAWVLLKVMAHRPALLELLYFVCVTVTMVGQSIANLQVPFEVRLSTASRSFSRFCYGVMLVGLHPAYSMPLLAITTATHFAVVNLSFYDQGDVVPDWVMSELAIELLVPVVATAIGIMINQINLKLYLYQAQSQQESMALHKLLGLSCDFVLPLHQKRLGSEICISHVKPEFAPYIGKVHEGDSVRNIMSCASFEHFHQQVERLAPNQPLMMPVTFKHGAADIAAEMLLIRCLHLDDADANFLVGVRVQEEIAPPDAVQALLPQDLENVRVSSGPFHGILPEGYGSSELGRSEAITTRTGMIFGCRPDEAWRQILKLGKKEHWLLPAANLSVQPDKLLGSGAFGLVCEGKYCGADVAVKVPRKSFSTKGPEAAAAATLLMDYLQELRLLRIARHPNIVVFYGAYMAPLKGEVALVFERVEGSTLDGLILADVPDNYKTQMMLDMSHALVYLHSLKPPIVHGDIKPGNVFVESREGLLQTKLADFGLARRMTVSAADMGGTLRWAAPEVVHGNRSPSTSADVYSLGQLMYFILTSQRPFSGLPQAECLAAKLAGFDPTEVWPSGPMIFLLKPMVDHARRQNPLERPRAAEVADVLENFMNCRQCKQQRGKSTEISGKDKPIFGPSKIPGIIELDEDWEEEELDADAELCQAFDRARMLVMNRMIT